LRGSLATMQRAVGFPDERIVLALPAPLGRPFASTALVHRVSVIEAGHRSPPCPCGRRSLRWSSPSLPRLLDESIDERTQEARGTHAEVERRIHERLRFFEILLVPPAAVGRRRNAAHALEDDAPHSAEPFVADDAPFAATDPAAAFDEIRAPTNYFHVPVGEPLLE